MMDCQLADNEEEAAPYIVLEDNGHELWTAYDGGHIWWRNQQTGERIPVFCIWPSDHSETSRAWKLLDLAERAPRYDRSPYPESVDLDDVRAAHAAGRVIQDPRRSLMVKIYCYCLEHKEPGLSEHPDLYEGVACDEQGKKILSHTSYAEKDVWPALGFDTNYCHAEYDAKFGRGNWELVRVSDATMIPVNNPRALPRAVEAASI